MVLSSSDCLRGFHWRGRESSAAVDLLPAFEVDLEAFGWELPATEEREEEVVLWEVACLRELAVWDSFVAEEEEAGVGDATSTLGTVAVLEERGKGSCGAGEAEEVQLTERLQKETLNDSPAPLPFLFLLSSCSSSTSSFSVVAAFSPVNSRASLDSSSGPRAALAGPDSTKGWPRGSPDTSVGCSSSEGVESVGGVVMTVKVDAR